jgi:hypothetical protein
MLEPRARVRNSSFQLAKLNWRWVSRSYQFELHALQNGAGPSLGLFVRSLVIRTENCSAAEL